jgi:hypothetical protein
MSHWTFVPGAYVLVFGVLATYWWRVNQDPMLEREMKAGPREGV